MPHIKIRPDGDGCFSVALDGTVVLEKESHQIASNIAGFLVRPHTMDGSECAEIARNILNPPADDDGEEARDRILEEQERQDFAQDEWEPGAADMLGADDE